MVIGCVLTVDNRTLQGETVSKWRSRSSACGVVDLGPEGHTVGRTPFHLDKAGIDNPLGPRSVIDPDPTSSVAPLAAGRPYVGIAVNPFGRGKALVRWGFEVPVGDEVCRRLRAIDFHPAVAPLGAIRIILVDASFPGFDLRPAGCILGPMSRQGQIHCPVS